MTLCKQCNEKITDDNHVYIRGEYYHDKCYIAYLVDILNLIYIDAEIIKKATQNNNAQANSKARDIIRKLDGI